MYGIIVHTPTRGQMGNICQHRNNNYSDIKLFLNSLLLNNCLETVIYRNFRVQSRFSRI